MHTSVRMGTIAMAATMWAAGAGAQLPAEVAERLERVVVPEDGDEFTGSYRMVASSVVAKPDGSKRKATEVEIMVDRPSAGNETRHLVRFLEDGVDTTADHRSEIEGRERRRSDRDEGDGGELELPVGDRAAAYRFTPPRAADGHLELDFEPGPTVAEDEAVRGTIAWDEASGLPLWVELEPVDPPSPVQEMHLRMDTTAVGDHLVVTRMVTTGRVKVLLMKREFTTDVRFEDVSFAPSGLAD